MGDRIKTEHSARLRLVHGEDCEGCQDMGLRMALAIVHLAGWRIVRPSEDDPHYVVFKETGWEIEHSAACRNAGQMLECELHRYLSDVCYGPPVEGLGRYRAELHPADDLWNLVRTDEVPTSTALLFTEEWRL